MSFRNAIRDGVPAAGDTVAQFTKPVFLGRDQLRENKMNHFAWTNEETIVQLSGMGPWGITYVNPADDPRKKALTRMALR
jgi:hypothetical protein